jgi:hypothetical protein
MACASFRKFCPSLGLAGMCFLDGTGRSGAQVRIEGKKPV